VGFGGTYGQLKAAEWMNLYANKILCANKKALTPFIGVSAFLFAPPLGLEPRTP
jgi:hypothetical protein